MKNPEYIQKDGKCFQIIIKAWSKAKTLFPRSKKALRWDKEVDCHFCGCCDEQ